MKRMESISFLVIVAAVSVLVIGGCAQRTAPLMGFGDFDVETQLSRDHIVVLERVEGTSETESILFGAVQVIDGNKLKIGPIPFFTEEFTCLDPPDTPIRCLLPKTEERAYYKALEATPEADAVFYKSWNQQLSGIPLLWETKRVTFSGKAFTLKSDRAQAEPQTVSEEVSE